ncbi:EAL domain-containing protein [Thiomicrorhabdus sediminis]|uniref:cyclic-guanylate-specific phosphodiesterase n=1 Tax=Thiomicrorhabdus sediminis TaxID=2580412 RepID=A0A4P9K407_9GAMM|nr:EAL domain-containing protein [Thiomicrorhabdus sediminis]QCU89190.1 EAL domain-containing protein [Thiomicrorhabdus sediminis]
MLVSFVLFLGVLFLVYSYLERQTKIDTQQRFHQSAQQTANLVDTLVQAKKDKVMLIALSLVQESSLKTVLRQRQSSEIDFSQFVEQVSNYSGLKNVWIQLLDAEGNSLYRSWTDKHGDKIIEKRKDLQLLYANPRIMQSVSVGAFDLTFKTMVPVYEDGQFIGVFEVLAKFNSIAQKLTDRGIESVILVDESYQNQLKNPFSKRFLGKHYIANVNALPELVQLIDQYELQHRTNSTNFIALSKEQLFVSFKKLYGTENQPLAVIYLFQPLQPVLESAYQASLQVYGILTFIYLFLLVLYLWRRANRVSRKASDFNESLLSEVKTKDQALQHQSFFWQSIIDGLDHTIQVVEADFSVTLKNNAAQYYDFADLVETDSQNCRDDIYNVDQPCEQDHRICPIKKCFSSGKSASIVQKIIAPNGKKRYFEFTSTPLFDDYGHVEKVIEIGHDITPYLKAKNQLETQKKELDFMAYHDSLTHLPNRVLFIDRLQQALDHCRISKTVVAVLFIDLDRFKEINDTHGHRVGDSVLVECAKRLKSAVREVDTVSRLGGDEFTVIIDEVKKSEEVADIVQNLLNVIAHPIFVDKRAFYLTTSIGVSLSSTDGKNPIELMKNADTAMYQAKASGRNNYAFYDPEMTEKALYRLEVEENLREAIKHRQFVMHYQPQYDIAEGKITGFEALVRWQHPEKGMIPPIDFIPLAEDTGMIIHIGQQVMFDAMLAAVNWRKSGIIDQRIAINVSARQFQDERLLELVEDSLMATGCQPEWIELEITESLVLSDYDYAANVLSALQKMGITVSIDDFGTGYSSLAELKRMPIDKLKIDQSFVRNIPEEREDCEITRAIISMANSLGLDLIAEGVETEQQAQFMVENGCQKAQGYLYSKPLPEEEIIQLLGRSH